MPENNKTPDIQNGEVSKTKRESQAQTDTWSKTQKHTSTQTSQVIKARRKHMHKEKEHREIQQK